MSPILGIWASQNYTRITNSYESIATFTSGQTVTFSSIPSTYKHLQVRVNWNSGSAGSDMGIKVNSSNPTQAHQLFGNGASAIAGSSDFDATYGWYLDIGNFNDVLPNIPTVAIIDFLDYADTNKFKTGRMLVGTEYNNNDTKSRVGLKSAFWSTTSAISSITFRQINSSFGSGTSIALYGIR